MSERFVSRISGGAWYWWHLRALRISVGGVLALLPLLAGSAGVLWLLSPGAARVDGAPAVGPSDVAFEPTVTLEENRLLEQVVKLAETAPAGAVRLLQERITPESSAALDFALGNLLVQLEELAAARAAYEQALEKAPRFRRARVNLGRVYLLEDHAEPAIELYRELIEEGRAGADVLLLLGHALLKEGDAVAAETAFRQALLLRPKDPDTMNRLLQALVLQERHGEVLALVRPMLEAAPRERDLWALMANAQLALNRVLPAARTIEQARRLGCADPEMLATLGDLHLNQGRPEDALAAYQAAFSKGVLNQDRLIRALEGFLLIGDPAGAERMLALLDNAEVGDAEAQSVPDRVTRLRLEAKLAGLKGEHARAVELCEEALRLDPLEGHCLLLHAELLQSAQRWEEAVMACERAARLPGFESDALVRQALIEVGRARYGDAIQLLEAAQAVKEQPHVARYIEQLRSTTSRAAALGP